MATRLFRGIAILFLLYTGTEMTAPQYCNEALGLIKTSEVFARSAGSTLSAVDNQSEKDQPFERYSSEEEDCFCCCAHVLPAIAGVLNTAPQIKTYPIDPQTSGLASPPLQSPYHPPRLS